MAVWVPDMFCNIHLGKSRKIAKNSARAKAKEKISTDLKSLEFYKFYDVCLNKFDNSQILQNKICRTQEGNSVVERTSSKMSFQKKYSIPGKEKKMFLF